MAASQAEVSQRLRRTIREMVHEGKSNQAIYNYIRDEYGKNQIAVPQDSWMRFLSMGLPYLTMGFIIVLALGFGWHWVDDRDNNGSDDDDDLTGETRESIEHLVASDKNNPLR